MGVHVFLTRREGEEYPPGEGETGRARNLRSVARGAKEYGLSKHHHCYPIFFRGDDLHTARTNTKEESHTFDMPGKELLPPSGSAIVASLPCLFLRGEGGLTLPPLLLCNFNL